MGTSPRQRFCDSLFWGARTSRQVVLGVRVSGTLPQRGLLCSLNTIFPRSPETARRAAYAAEDAIHHRALILP